MATPTLAVFILSSSSPNPSRTAPPTGSWLKTLYLWHWISSALALVGMLAFAATGITLNHAGQIEAKPQQVRHQAVLPGPLLQQLQQPHADPTPLPEAVVQWLQHEWRLDASQRTPEWSDEEVYVAMPRPGGDAWVRVDRQTGDVEYEQTDRGWVSWLNDLHKGRHTGMAWGWFIDVFAVSCLVFSITGLLILKMHALRRPLVWPMVGLGLLIPMLIILLAMH